MTRVVGVDVGGTNTKVVLAGDDGAIERTFSFETGGDAGPESFLRRLLEKIDPFFGGPDAPGALGLAFAGLVELDGRIVQAPNLPKFVDFDLRGQIARGLGGIPVGLDNDVNTALRGEYEEGAARGVRHAAMLSLGTGVGGALLLDGRIYRGASGTAAELGHTLLDYDGPACPCGQKGHVESYLSTHAIVEHAQQEIARAGPDQGRILRERIADEGELSPRVVSEAADAGDALARSILADAGVWLGLACASIVNAFNPELFVIGGGVAGSGEHLLAPARRTLRERAMPRPAARVQLVVAALGQDGAARGAVHLGRAALAALDGRRHPGQ